MARDDGEDLQMNAHGNWVRMECLERAMERNKYRGKLPEELVQEAKVYENYVFNRRPAKVLKLVKGKGKKDGR